MNLRRLASLPQTSGKSKTEKKNFNRDFCKAAAQRETFYLLKIVLGELVGDAEQLAAGVRVCEGPDAQTVGGVQLSLEELAAGLLYLGQLQKAGSREQRLDVSLLDGHLRTGRFGTSHTQSYKRVTDLKASL